MSTRLVVRGPTNCLGYLISALIPLPILRPKRTAFLEESPGNRASIGRCFEASARRPTRCLRGATANRRSNLFGLLRYSRRVPGVVLEGLAISIDDQRHGSTDRTPYSSRPARAGSPRLRGLCKSRRLSHSLGQPAGNPLDLSPSGSSGGGRAHYPVASAERGRPFVFNDRTSHVGPLTAQRETVPSDVAAHPRTRTTGGPRGCARPWFSSTRLDSRAAVRCRAHHGLSAFYAKRSERESRIRTD